jgi:protoheme IX farnesyltransferase
MRYMPNQLIEHDKHTYRLSALSIISKLFQVGHCYWELCKPRVVALMILTVIVGMQLATPGLVPWQVLLYGNVGIAMIACAAAAINHIVDRRFDTLMRRTQNRPLPMQQLSTLQALIFALVLGCSGMVILITLINKLTAILALLTFIGYALVYTVYLKHATPQNIVIGGLSGALPPLLGWTAVTGQISPQPLLLVLIIFLWTPPHFWSLAVHRRLDYAKAEIPMLPNTHGVAYTKILILLYTFLLFASSLLPFALGASSWIYLCVAVVLGGRFFYWVWRLYRSNDDVIAWKCFRFSIIYLMNLFLALLIDHWSLS